MLFAKSVASLSQAQCANTVPYKLIPWVESLTKFYSLNHESSDESIKHHSDLAKQA